MNNVKHLENLYRIYWEYFTRKQIFDTEQISNIKVFWKSIIFILLSFWLLANNRINSIEISFTNQIIITVSIFLTINLYPYFILCFLILKKEPIAVKKEIIKTFFYYRTFDLFNLTVSEYNELMEFLNVMVQEVPPKEETQTIKDAFVNLFDKNNSTGRFKALFVNSKFLSVDEFNEYTKRNLFYNSIQKNKEVVISDEVYSLLDDYSSKGIDFLLLDKFKRKEKSFKNYYLEHLNYNGSQDVGFFWFSLIVPLSPQWKLDTVKAILNSCRIQMGFKNYQIEGSDSIKNRKKALIEKDLILIFMNKEKIKHTFAKYSEEQFKKIFIKNHTSDDLLKTLLLLLKLDPIEIPVLKSWHEILHFVDNYSKIYKVPNNSVNLDKFQGVFSYSYVKSYAELGEMAHLLNNCLKSRHEKLMTGISHILKVKKDGELYGAIEISNGKVVEMAGYKNSALSESSQIQNDLRKHILN